MAAGNTQSIVLGGGCFWCLEALYVMVNGVQKVTNGYAGGASIGPSYNQVCAGTTGHAEVVKIDFDASMISLGNIVKIFWGVHDPTTPNQQGGDIGTQYRSMILYSNDEQLAIINDECRQAQTLWENPIITEISKLKTFYPAEPYHQNYFANNPSQAYCQIVINPKLIHFKRSFSKYLKPTL